MSYLMRNELIDGTHILVKNDDDTVVVNEQGDWLILNVKDQSLHYVVPNPNILEFFGVQLAASLEAEEEVVVTVQEPVEQALSSPTTSTVGKWNRAAILLLIDEYKKHLHLFKSSSVKNESVWLMIFENLTKQGYNYTKTQIENKFKYLKARYVKRKDNMGDLGSGEAPFSFEYFEEFDDIFRDKPQYKPIALASSSEAPPNTKETPSSSDVEENIEPNRKKRKSESLKVLEWLKEKDASRESKRERRHKEKLEFQQNAANRFENLFE